MQKLKIEIKKILYIKNYNIQIFHMLKYLFGDILLLSICSMLDS